MSSQPISDDDVHTRASVAALDVLRDAGHPTSCVVLLVRDMLSGFCRMTLKVNDGSEDAFTELTEMVEELARGVLNDMKAFRAREFPPS